MSVAEMIEKLKTMPVDANVSCYEGYSWSITEIEYVPAVNEVILS